MSFFGRTLNSESDHACLVDIYFLFERNLCTSYINLLQLKSSIQARTIIDRKITIVDIPQTHVGGLSTYLACNFILIMI